MPAFGANASFSNKNFTVLHIVKHCTNSVISPFSIFRAAHCSVSTSRFPRQPARSAADTWLNTQQPHRTINSFFRTFVSTRLIKDSPGSMVTIGTRPGALYNSRQKQSGVEKLFICWPEMLLTKTHPVPPAIG